MIRVFNYSSIKLIEVIPSAFIKQSGWRVGRLSLNTKIISNLEKQELSNVTRNLSNHQNLSSSGNLFSLFGFLVKHQ